MMATQVENTRILFLMFQVEEAGCVIGKVEYEADNERGFKVIMLVGDSNF